MVLRQNWQARCTYTRADTLDKKVPYSWEVESNMKRRYCYGLPIDLELFSPCTTVDAFFQARNNNKPRPNNARSRDGPVIGFFDNSINFCFSQLLPRLPPDFLCQDRRSENWLSVRVCVCQSFFPVAFPEKLVHYPRSIFLFSLLLLIFSIPSSAARW